MTEREYKLAVIGEVWSARHAEFPVPRGPIYDPIRLIEFLRGQDHDRGIDAVLYALGLDPAKLHDPLFRAEPTKPPTQGSDT